MDSARTQRVFLTGATGTIGGAILGALQSTGRYQVDCLVRSPEAASWVSSLGASGILANMTDCDLRARIKPAREYKFIVHAAQEHYSTHSDAEIADADRLAVESLQRLCSERTQLMIYTSGVWIFGDCGQKEITDATPFKPFEAAAARSDLIGRLRAQTVYPWAHLCPPSFVYGTRGPLLSVVRTMQTGPIDIIDDEHVLWSVVERDDLARAYLAMLLHAKSGDFHVVAEEDPVSRVFFYERIGALIKGSQIRRRSRAFFEERWAARELETLFGSQPVDARGIRNSCLWRPQAVFSKWIEQHIPVIAG